MLKEYERAASSAAEYLLSRRASGRWTDFVTRAGESDTWTTAYVAFHLVEGGVERSLLMDSSTYLLSKQRPSGGWSYNEHVPQDADSTSWCIRALRSILPDAGAELAAARQQLLRHRHEHGFSTYADPEPIRAYLGLEPEVQVDGWCVMAHPDVTGCATLALLACEDPGDDEQESSSGLDALRNCQRRDGSWDSYWWRTPLYATAMAVEALRESGDPDDRKIAASGLEWIAAAQREDGSWDSGDCEGGAFVTGLALRALQHEPRLRSHWERGADWLRRRQRPDGAWDPRPMLRISPPWECDPSRVIRWKRGGLGVPVIVADQNRLFTTSACFAALAGARNVLN